MFNLLDVSIIFIILLTGALGFKRGVFKEIVVFVGIILVFVLAYKFKNILGDFLVLNLPFIKFGSFLHGAEAFNIIFYQTIAFIVIAILLYLVYEIIVSITGIFEKLLKITIILGIPSKILGFLVGLVEGYVLAFVAAFLISQPILGLEFVDDSKWGNKIVNNSPILTNFTSDTIKIINEVIKLKDIDNKNDVNLKLIDLILKNNVTSKDVVQKLIDKKKLNIEGVDTIIENYKEVRWLSI